MKEHHFNKHPYQDCPACIETSADVIQNPTKYGLSEQPSHEEICSVLDSMDNGLTKQHLAIHEWRMCEPIFIEGDTTQTELKPHTIYILPLNKENDSVCAGWTIK